MNRQLTISVGLIQYQEKFLLTRRLAPKNPEWHLKWELPGGKIDPNETPIIALHREILEETNLRINSPTLLGVYTHFWNTPDHTQQTFILLYHCYADHQNVQLKEDENDAFVWENFDSILKKDNLLDGTLQLLQELYVDSPVLA